MRYVPYFYIPKIGRRFYSVFLFLSILIHSGLWLKRKRNHILIASWAFPEAVATSWLSKIYNTKFFFKVHGTDINLHGDIKPRAKQIVAASKHANGILSVSKALKNKMIAMGVEGNKIKVIYNGVNHQKFGVPQAQKITDNYVLYVGNLKITKGVFELLEGFAKISVQFPHLKLVFAGPGSLKKQLLDKAKYLVIENNITFLGSVDHKYLPALMQHASVVALPSYNEGVPNVLLESMACGTPVLASNVGGIPEVIDPNICGQLINAKSSEEVSKGLLHLLENDWDSDLIKAHSKKFSWEKNRDELLTLLQKN
jgi:glycosyltransferase involved in cell wall biosynthesis